MTKPRLTPAQKRVMLAAAGGGLVRRRGAFGDRQAAATDPRFAAERTLTILWRAGLLRPAEAWGAFEAVPGAWAPPRRAGGAPA